MVKVSIIVPVYNVEKYIEKCILSLINQSLREIEIILINDGSTDGTIGILREYEKKDNRIRVIDQENRGISYSRNIGINMAKGEFIGFVDSDDWVSNDMYRILYEKMKLNDADFATCNSYNVKKNIILPEFIVSNKILNVNSQNIKEFFDKTMISVASVVWKNLYKKEIIINKKIYFQSREVILQEDYLFNCMYALFIKKAILIDENLYYYRNRSTSISKSKRDELYYEKALNLPTLINRYIESINRAFNTKDFMGKLGNNIYSSLLFNNECLYTKELYKTLYYIKQDKNIECVIRYLKNNNSSFKDSINLYCLKRIKKDSFLLPLVIYKIINILIYFKYKIKRYKNWS